MNALKSALLGAFVVAGIAAPLRPVQAQSVGGFAKVKATPVVVTSYDLPAFGSVTITTTNLSPGADTVLHVQDYASGAFIAGNDDVSQGNFSSRVVIGSGLSQRKLRIIVRAYGDSSGGKATLTIAPLVGAAITSPINFAGATAAVLTEPLRAGTSVFTGQVPGGASNTVLLVVGGGGASPASHAYGFDDNSGTASMANLVLSEACGGPCKIVVGVAQPPDVIVWSGTTMVYWDNHAVDADGDGIGEALEARLGTVDDPNDPRAVDFDQDGISDLLEIAGSDSPDSASLNYPEMGANPLRPDLFMEMDWITNPDPMGDPDGYQMTGEAAEHTAAVFAPDIAVHIDIGRVNTSGNTAWGSWGGAHRNPDQDHSNCHGLSTSRNAAATFFHVLSGYIGSTNVGQKCVVSSPGGQTVAHETGHALYLNHGGSMSLSVEANCRPNYPSIINYAYESTVPSFSRNTQFPGVLLNAVSMDEDRPFGNTSVEFLGNSPFEFKVDAATGHVDWNRDGMFSPAGKRVRGLPMATNEWINCSSPVAFKRSVFPTFDSTEAAGSWASSLFGDRFYLFSRRTSNGLIQYRYASGSSVRACSSETPLGVDTNAPCIVWSPDANAEGTTVPGGVFTRTSPSAARFGSFRAEKLLLAYVSSASQLVYQVGTPNSVVGDNWSSAVLVGGGIISEGDPSLITSPDASTVTLFYPANGQLNSVVFSAATGAWSVPRVERKEDGTPVAAIIGVGLTWGFESAFPDRRLYAAVPFNGDIAGQIQFLRRDPATLRWTNLNWGDGYTHTDTRPGLAYVPFDKSVSNSVGRFYWAHNFPDDRIIRLAFTEGNDSSPSAVSNRLGVMGYRSGGLREPTQGGVSLLYDLAKDDNLRLAHSHQCFGNCDGQNYRLVFLPIADGILNGVLKDQDDYAVLMHNLRPALGRVPPDPIR